MLKSSGTVWYFLSLMETGVDNVNESIYEKLTKNFNQVTWYLLFPYGHANFNELL